MVAMAGFHAQRIVLVFHHEAGRQYATERTGNSHSSVPPTVFSP